MADVKGARLPPSIHPGVSVLLTDVAFEVRRLERMVGHDLPMTPALAFWALSRAEQKRVARGTPSEVECVRAAMRELVRDGAH